MTFDFKFPDVGEGINEGKIVKWHVKVGDTVKADQVLAEIETDKAVVQIPSPQAGTVLQIYYAEGQKVRVGEALITLGEKGEKVNPKSIPLEVKKFHGLPTPESPIKSVSVVGSLEEAPEEKKLKPLPAKTSKPLEVEKHLAAPATRKLARELKADLSKIKGTGPNGVITSEDVRKSVEKTAPTASPTTPITPQASAEKGPWVTFDKYGRVLRVPISGVREAIARKMVESKTKAPHAVAMEDIDVTELEFRRKKEKPAAQEKGIKLTLLAYVSKACIAAIKEHPYVNSTWDDQAKEIVVKNYYNLGYAVDTSVGLMVPVLKDVDKRSIFDIAHWVEVFADQCRSREININDLQGGTFTITNYGSLGATYGVPIINYPEVAILGLGTARDRAVVIDGQVRVRKILPVSLSFDHRVVDGAYATEFLQALKKYLEDPDLMFASID